MRKTLLFCALLFSSVGFAQVKMVNIQASGLTCSMCSNAINKSLKSLPYVNQVKADIKNSSFEVSFKNTDEVDFDQLKKKVEDAGFFVARFEAVVIFPNTAVENDTHVQLGGVNYHFLNVNKTTLQGEKKLHVLDKGYVTTKEYKRNAIYTKMECYKTGVMGSCCSIKNKTAQTRIYHFTI